MITMRETKHLLKPTTSRHKLPSLFFKKNFLPLKPQTPKQANYCSTNYSANTDSTFLRLPILDNLYQKIKNDYPQVNFSKTAFICGQHLLNTTPAIFDFTIRLGANPENIFVVGKSYSTNKRVVEQIKNMGIYCQKIFKQIELGDFSDSYTINTYDMWSKFKEKNCQVDNIVILDDGGAVLKHIPFEVKEKFNGKIIGIEQTSSGIAHSTGLPFPTIEVASSAVKKWLEPPMVTQKILDKFSEKLNEINTPKSFFENKDNLTIGIIGLGNIGKSLLESLALTKKYKKFIVFDQDKHKQTIIQKEFSEKYKDIVFVDVDSPDTIICSVDVLFGCVGKDILQGSLKAFNAIGKPLMMISCGSKDIEFLSFLKYIQNYIRGENTEINPLNDIDFQNGFKAPIKIVRGGTPFNFDNAEESVPAKDIAVIRGIKAAAIVQASLMLENKVIPNNYMVEPEFQKFISTQWLKDQPAGRYKNEEIELFTDKQKITAASGGKNFYEMNANYVEKVKSFSIDKPSVFPSTPITALINSPISQDNESTYKNTSNEILDKGNPLYSTTNVFWNTGKKNVKLSNPKWHENEKGAVKHAKH